jgi:hypothetical protein
MARRSITEIVSISGIAERSVNCPAPVWFQDIRVSISGIAERPVSSLLFPAIKLRVVGLF